MEADRPALVIHWLFEEYSLSCRVHATISAVASGIDSPRFLSLFSGCGGLDLGFTQAGFTSTGAFDVDPEALNTYERNLEGPAKCVDLCKVNPRALTQRPLDVLLAGSPCQGFSTAGLRRFDDPRNSLLLTAGRFAAELKPKVFLLENVAGALLGEHRKYWQQLDDQLRGAGFKTQTLVVRAEHFGVPQIRKRVIMLGWRTAFCGEVALQMQATPLLTKVLGGVAGLPNHDPQPLKQDANSLRIAKRIGPGQKLCNVRDGVSAVHTWNIPEVFGSVSEREIKVLTAVMRVRRRVRRRDTGDADPVSLRDLRFEGVELTETLLASLLHKNYLRRIGRYIDLTHTFNGKFRRLDRHVPSLTVDTRFCDYRYFLHPSEHRGFSVREAARIQGFPDGFVFHGSSRVQRRLVGNAVPPPVARTLANAVRRTLLSS